MRLTAEQKAAALAYRPGASLVRFGAEWGLVWRDGKTWRGQLLTRVDPDEDLTSDGDFIVWTTAEVQGPTRRVVVNALSFEAKS